MEQTTKALDAITWFQRKIDALTNERDELAETLKIRTAVLESQSVKDAIARSNVMVIIDNDRETPQCPKCKAFIFNSDNFCPMCGQRIEVRYAAE